MNVPNERFELCPVCDRVDVVRLRSDWQELEAPIGIIGCGNPWHYDGLEQGREV